MQPVVCLWPSAVTQQQTPMRRRDAFSIRRRSNSVMPDYSIHWRTVLRFVVPSPWHFQTQTQKIVDVDAVELVNGSVRYEISNLSDRDKMFETFSLRLS